MNFVCLGEIGKVAFEKLSSNSKSHHDEIKIKKLQKPKRHCLQHTTSKVFKIQNQTEMHLNPSPQPLEYLQSLQL